jgi:hypothetical protein
MDFKVSNLKYFPKIAPFMRKMWKSMAEPDLPQTAIKYGARALRSG